MIILYMQPFFCRVGSKKTISSKILKIIPEHKTYVEPFVGGGAIYFSKEPSRIEVINDLDKKLIQGYRLLKKINEPMIDRINAIIERVEKVKKSERLELLNIIANAKARGVDDGLKLYQILINTCNTFGAKGYGKIFKESLGNRKMKNINEYKERLENTKIFSSDYKNIIKKFDATDTFFFLDPPYEKSEGLYKNAVIDYEEMNDLLSKIKGKFLLTINSSSVIKNIFKNFNMKEIKVKGGANNEKGLGQDRMELLITNY